MRRERQGEVGGELPGWAAGTGSRDWQPGRVLINGVLMCLEQANQMLMSLGLTNG